MIILQGGFLEGGSPALAGDRRIPSGPVVFRSGSGNYLSIEVCRKISNQGPVDPDQVFNRDHDRDEDFEIRV